MKTKEIVKGTIAALYPTHILIKLPTGQVGILHISEVSDYFVYGLDKIFQVGQEFEFEIIEIDQGAGKVCLSWKNLVPRFLKNPFKFELAPTKFGFENLQKFLEGEIDD